MTILEFPPVEHAMDDGLIAIGGDLEPDSLILAYRSGIFPWPIDDGQLAWFAPPERAILNLEEFHVPSSLRRVVNRNELTTALNSDFGGVIQRCAEVKNRGTQNGTWITRDMIEAYTTLFERGNCLSVETYRGNELVGGIYGVRINRFFAAESSFYRAPNASKIAMLRLVEHLRSEGITWFDCQVITPFSASFGAREIRRSRFMELLAQAVAE